VQSSTTAATMTVTPTTVATGGTVAVSISNGPGNPTDWVALIPAGAADSAFVDWQYLNGTKTQPASGLTNAALTFPMPATAGSYVLKSFANGGWPTLPAAPPITVQGSAPTATITVTPTTVTGGGTVSVTVANGPANATDWVALIPAGAADSA